MVVSSATGNGAVRAWKSDDELSCLYYGDTLELMACCVRPNRDRIWTDPPYNLSNDGITCVGANGWRGDRSRGDMDHEFNLTWLAVCYRLSSRLAPFG